jgi:hypothetical protein
LKTPLIFSIVLDTTDLAASSFDEKADLILSRTEETVSFAAFISFVTVAFQTMKIIMSKPARSLRYE